MRPTVKYFNPNYYIYYQLADVEQKRRIITHNGILLTIDDDDIKYRSYLGVVMLFIDEKPNDSVLIEYLKNYKKWLYSAKLNKIFSIDFSRGAVIACQQTFFKLIKNFKDHEPIKCIEYKWFENCKNNALVYLRNDDITVDCISYDRKMCYGSILGSKLKIPTKKGRQFNFKKLPIIENMKYGFYRVKITTLDHDTLKICFVLSPSNTYTVIHTL